MCYSGIIVSIIVFVRKETIKALSTLTSCFGEGVLFICPAKVNWEHLFHHTSELPVHSA